MDEKSGEGKTLGLFELGERYDEVDPRLGRLHESRHVETGRPALTLLPGDSVEWQPEGDWSVSLLYQRQFASVSLRVDEAPPAADAMELANLLTLTNVAFGLVEDRPGLSAHLASASPPRSLYARRLAIVSGAVGLSLFLGFWWMGSRDSGVPLAPVVVAREVSMKEEAQILTDSWPPAPKGFAYPLPAKPFSNQAAAPCYPEVDEVEINGGCWVALDRRPPCRELQAEYKDKCYLPVTKSRTRPAQSVQP